MSTDAEAPPHGSDGLEPLAGYTVGITAARRREELGVALRRRGADVLYGPAIQIVPLADDRDLRAATQRCLSAPLDVVVATTGIGFRGWMEAADTWGLAERLAGAIGNARVLARGPKARGAVRACGLREVWSPESESFHEVLEHLLSAGGLAGTRIAVQLHGEPLPRLAALQAAGAEVVEAPVYRWAPPDDPVPLHRLVQAAAGASVDAVAFTSAPAAASFLAAADAQGCGAAVRAALHGPVVACCVGAVTARPLQRAGIPVARPNRPRLGALVRAMVEQVPLRRGQDVAVAGHRVELRGQAAVVDGRLVPLSLTCMALLRELAVRPGHVVARADLLRASSGEGADEHAVEVAVGRLRTALGDPRIIQTVVKRGYRLSCEPARTGV